jgi:hypothetical protein
MFQSGNRELGYPDGVFNVIESADPAPAEDYANLGTEPLPNSYMFAYGQGLSSFVLPPFGTATMTMTVNNTSPYQPLNPGDCSSSTGDFSILAFELGTDNILDWNNSTGQIIECNTFSAINP